MYAVGGYLLLRWAALLQHRLVLWGRHLLIQLRRKQLAQHWKLRLWQNYLWQWLHAHGS